MSKTCKQCRYFDYSHEICRHSCGSKSYEDVGEEDTCEQFANKQKRMNSEEVLDGLESIRNDYGCQAEIYEQRIIDDTIKLIKDHERTITNQQHVIKCLEYDISDISKEQEAKALTMEELRSFEETPCWFESHGTYRGKNGFWIIPAMFRPIFTGSTIMSYISASDGVGDYGELGLSAYNKAWRCWTARPTDEQRKKMKWE